MFSRVLVATDGSRFMDEAINYAASIFLYSEFHILCVKKRTYRGTQLTTMYQKMLDESARDAIEHGRKVLARSGITGQCEVCDGKPSREILRYIKANDINILIMMTRTHEQTGVERFVLGSTSENVLKKVKIPVLFLNPQNVDHDGSVNNILLGTDGSISSKNAENFSLILANNFGAKITGVVALESGWKGGDAEAEKILNNLKWKADQFNVKLEKMILRGPSTARIITEKAPDFDLIVIGAGRPSFLKRVKIGHVALEIINTAPRPVIVVRGYSGSRKRLP